MKKRMRDSKASMACGETTGHFRGFKGICRKITAAAVVLTLGIGLAACDGQLGNGGTTLPSTSGGAASTEQANSGFDGTQGKILIAYFSRTGTTQTVAKEIEQLTGGTLQKIETATPYPEDYDDCTQIAKREKEEKARPKLSTQVEHMEQFDVVFLGYPIWWGTAPMAVFTFLQSYDLSGKTVVPFCTSGGSGIEESMDGIRELCPDSTILKGLSANQSGAVKPWLEEIGIL